MHKEASDEGGFDRGNEECDDNGQGDAMKVDIVHAHGQNGADQQREEHENVFSDVLANIVRIMAVPGSVTYGLRLRGGLRVWTHK